MPLGALVSKYLHFWAAIKGPLILVFIFLSIKFWDFFWIKKKKSSVVHHKSD
jgi:hypothetical protein